MTGPSDPTILVLRHGRERLSKCSLRGLESRRDFRFLRHGRDELPDLSDTIVLAMDAPPLTAADAGRPLLVVDGTWRLAERMVRAHAAALAAAVSRSIPAAWHTAYPRRQTACPDPDRGLASVEAIYAARCILGGSTDGLLDHYRWADEFLRLNERAIAAAAR